MDVLTFTLNSGAALILGILIGLERQWRHHPAGLRTNALVALGASLFVSLAILMNDTNSPTRVASYVVSGLGFIGGGVILRDGLTVKGMNTAATIWCSGAVGTLAGSGFPWHATVGTMTVLLANTVLRPIVHRIEMYRPTDQNAETYYRLRVSCQHPHEAVIRMVLLRHVGQSTRMSLQGLATEDTEKDRTMVIADIYAVERNDRFMEDLVKRISIEPEVVAVSWERSRA